MTKYKSIALGYDMCGTNSSNSPMKSEQAKTFVCEIATTKPFSTTLAFNFLLVTIFFSLDIFDLILFVL